MILKRIGTRKRKALKGKKKKKKNYSNILVILATFPFEFNKKNFQIVNTPEQGVMELIHPCLNPPNIKTQEQLFSYSYLKFLHLLVPLEAVRSLAI